MTDKIELRVDNRNITGKKVRFLREDGIVPVHLFGHNIDSVLLQASEVELSKALSKAGRTRLIDLKIGEDQHTRNVMVREVQREPIRGDLVHVDFYEVNMAEKIRVEVPITLSGESPALKMRENMLSQDMNSLTIECLPDKMPDRIEIDISVLTESDQSIRVKDVSPGEMDILNDPDLVIVKVSQRPVEVIEEARPQEAEGTAPTAAAEGES